MAAFTRLPTAALALCLALLLVAHSSSAAPTSVNGDIIDPRRAAGSNSANSPSLTSSSSGSSSAGAGMSCSGKSIVMRGNLSVSEAWSEAAPLQLDYTPLERGQCAGYAIPAAALADSACSTKSPDSYILVEFWQLGSNATAYSGGSLAGPGSGRSSLPKVPFGDETPVADVRVLAARGTKPSLTWGPEDTLKVVPPIRDPSTGVTPVGSFQDDAGVVYNRPVLRVLFPTDSPVTDVGEPADANTWYITIANLPDQPSAALPAYAIRASCITPNAAVDRNSSSNSNSSNSSSSVKGPALVALHNGMPCPVPSPGGKQCNGHGSCRVDSAALLPEYSRFCECDQGWGSWGCQQQLLSLPLNAPVAITATIPPGKWGYWEVQLPPSRQPGSTAAAAAAAAAAGGSAVAGGGGGSSGGSSEQLLLTAERVLTPGMGGNPLLFLKPFGTKDHNEPALDGLSLDVANYADLRSFQLQLNRQFINYRLPLQREAMRSVHPGPGSRAVTSPRRWYVAVYNSNASRLSEPVKVQLTVQYRDLTRQAPACPFDCYGRGRCVDPLSGPMQQQGSGRGGGSSSSRRDQQGSGAVAGAAGFSSSGLNPDFAGQLALGPLQDQSPLDAGFMCSCVPGFGGLMCEGRVLNISVGAGEQRFGPEVLEPGSWFYYVTNIDAGFNSASNDLGIHWVIGEPSTPPSNYSNAYISFDQGPVHRQQLMGVDRRPPVRRGMTPYSKLLMRSNPPLPLQVPGGQLTPGGTYVVSIFNNDYVVAQPYIFSLSFYTTAENSTFLHPYMSILLGVTAAVILCLAMTLCKRVIMRYGLWPWGRWGQQRRHGVDGLAGGGGPNSLALVLMAQQSNRGVPADVVQAFPCRPYAAKEYQKRQAGVVVNSSSSPRAGTAAAAPQQQQQQRGGGNSRGSDDDVPRPAADTALQGGADQDGGRTGRRAAAAAAAAAAGAATGAAAVAIGAAADAGSTDQQQQVSDPLRATPANKAEGGDVTPLPAVADSGESEAASLAAAAAGAEGSKDDEGPSCSVCLCEYVAGELVRQLPCGHEFHQACIDCWMQHHGTCPICRAALWHGALQTDDASSSSSSAGMPPGSSDDGSRVRRSNDAAIYVHHELPGGNTGGFGGGRAAVAAVAAASGGRRRRRSQRQRQQQERQRHHELLHAFTLWTRQEQPGDQQHVARPSVLVVEQAPAGNDNNNNNNNDSGGGIGGGISSWWRRGAGSHQQQQQQHSADEATRMELGLQQQAAAMRVQQQLQQQQQQQQQRQQPPHHQQQLQQQQQQPPPGSTPAVGSTDTAADRFMGAFSLGRRQRDQQQQ